MRKITGTLFPALTISRLALLVVLVSSAASAANWSTIDPPGSAGLTKVYGLNSSGQLVGSFYDGHAIHGFLFSGGYTTIDAPAAVMTVCTGINDSGQIAGYYWDSSFVSHGFLLDGSTFTTIDPPGSLQISHRSDQ